MTAAALTITRTTSSHGPDVITIYVRSPDFGGAVDLAVTVTPEDFAMALTGRAHVPADLRDRSAERAARPPRE